jgi:uncharacterized protein
MHQVFADTSYWIAIIRKADALHLRAKRLNDEVLSNAKLVTSDLVCVEFLNYFSTDGELARRMAIEMYSAIKSEPTYEFVRMTEALHTETSRRYQQASDQSWSYTDCSSFAIMSERGIQDFVRY